MKEGWEIKKLGEICTINPPKKEAISKVTSDDMVSFLPMEDLDIKAYYTEPKQHRLFSDVQSSYTYFTNGDVLLAKVTPCFENGKIGIAHNLINGIGFGSSEFLVFRLKEAILKEFLYYYLQNKTFVKEAIKNLTGSSGLRRVPKIFVENSKIPVPSIAEQEKIVAELDCLSGIIEKKKQQLKEYDALAQSIFYEMFGDPIENEKGWEVKDLGEVCDVRDGTHDSPKYLEQSDYVLITSKNIVGGTIDFSTVNYISEEDYININKRSCVDEGDIIMAMIGTIGNPIIVKDIDRKFCIKNVALIKFANSSLVANVYIRALLDNKSYCQYILSQNKGGTQKFVALGTIRKLKTPLPPLALQQQFASKIEAIEKQKVLIKKSIEEVETLFNSRMDEYFN